MKHGLRAMVLVGMAAAGASAEQPVCDKGRDYMTPSEQTAAKAVRACTADAIEHDDGKTSPETLGRTVINTTCVSHMDAWISETFKTMALNCHMEPTEAGKATYATNFNKDMAGSVTQEIIQHRKK